MGTDTVQTPLSRSFCRHVVAADEPLVIRDSLEDHRVWDNPAIEESGVRAYLGTPVHDPHGAPVASLCVIDDRSREWSDADRAHARGARAVRDRRDPGSSTRSAPARTCAASSATSRTAISHDVKGPLQTIGWVLEDVEENHGRDFNRDTAQLVGLAKETISRTRQMIDGLLELGSVEPGQEPERAPVELSGVLDEVVGMLGGDARRLDARVHVPHDLPTVSGDRRQLTMLFRNLVGNALKFHRPGVPPRVRIAWRMADGAFELDVSDNGVGIPEALRERGLRPVRAPGPLGGPRGLGGRAVARRAGGREPRRRGAHRLRRAHGHHVPRCACPRTLGSARRVGPGAGPSATSDAEPVPNAALVPGAVSVAIAKAA